MRSSLGWSKKEAVDALFGLFSSLHLHNDVRKMAGAQWVMHGGLAGDPP